MTTTHQLGPDRMLDVREIPCSIKHGLIIKTFVDLAVGEHFVLRNGHDPVPLRYQFEAEFLARIFHTMIEQRGVGRVEMAVPIEHYAPRHSCPFRDSLSRLAAPV